MLVTVWLVAAVLLSGIGWIAALVCCASWLVKELRGIREEKARGNRVLHGIARYLTGNEKTVHMTEEEIEEARRR